MQFCESCGRQLSDTAKFCKGCGSTVVQETKPEGPFDNEVPPQEPQSKKRVSSKARMPAGHNPDFRKSATEELVVEEEPPKPVTRKKLSTASADEGVTRNMARPFMTPKFVVYILTCTVLLLSIWLGFIYNNYVPFHDWANTNASTNTLYITIYFGVAIVGYQVIWGQKKPSRVPVQRQAREEAPMDEDIQEPTEEPEAEEVEVVEAD